MPIGTPAQTSNLIGSLLQGFTNRRSQLRQTQLQEEEQVGRRALGLLGTLSPQLEKFDPQTQDALIQGVLGAVYGKKVPKDLQEFLRISSPVRQAAWQARSQGQGQGQGQGGQGQATGAAPVAAASPLPSGEAEASAAAPAQGPGALPDIPAAATASPTTARGPFSLVPPDELARRKAVEAELTAKGQAVGRATAEREQFPATLRTKVGAIADLPEDQRRLGTMIAVPGAASLYTLTNVPGLVSGREIPGKDPTKFYHAMRDRMGNMVGGTEYVMSPGYSLGPQVPDPESTGTGISQYILNERKEPVGRILNAVNPAFAPTVSQHEQLGTFAGPSGEPETRAVSLTTRTQKQVPGTGTSAGPGAGAFGSFLSPVPAFPARSGAAAPASAPASAPGAAQAPAQAPAGSGALPPPPSRPGAAQAPPQAPQPQAGPPNMADPFARWYFQNLPQDPAPIPPAPRGAGGAGRAPGRYVGQPALTPLQRESADLKMKAVNNTLRLMDELYRGLPMLKSIASASKVTLGSGTDAGVIRQIATRFAGLSPEEAHLAGLFQTAPEHINTLRAYLGATGFRSVEAFHALVAMAGNPLQDPRITKTVMETTLQALLAQKAAIAKALSGPGGPVLDQPTIRLYLMSTGGDRPKAATLAQEDGWVIPPAAKRAGQ